MTLEVFLVSHIYMIFPDCPGNTELKWHSQKISNRRISKYYIHRKIKFNHSQRMTYITLYIELLKFIIKICNRLASILSLVLKYSFFSYFSSRIAMFLRIFLILHPKSIWYFVGYSVMLSLCKCNYELYVCFLLVICLFFFLFCFFWFG